MSCNAQYPVDPTREYSTSGIPPLGSKRTIRAAFLPVTGAIAGMLRIPCARLFAGPQWKRKDTNGYGLQIAGTSLDRDQTGLNSVWPPGRRRTGYEAVHLFVSATGAPNLPPVLPPMGHLGNRELISEVSERYGGIPFRSSRMRNSWRPSCLRCGPIFACWSHTIEQCRSRFPAP
jgi:hypothetical protein